MKRNKIKRQRLLPVLLCVFALTACNPEDQTGQARGTADVQQTAQPRQQTKQSEQVKQTEPSAQTEPGVEEDSIETMCSRALDNQYTLEQKIGGVTEAYASPAFWIDDEQEAQRVLMSEAEIQAYNAAVVQDGRLKVADMTKKLETIPAEDIRTMISQYEIGDYAYLDGELMTDSQRQYLENRRNLEALDEMDTMTVRYGLIVNETDVRSFPSVGTLMDTDDDWEFDYFQESSLKVGEGVRICHETADGAWCFVQAKNDAGWVWSEDIAFCSFAQMCDYLTSEDFIIVTKPADVVCGVENLHLSMGCRLLCGADGATAKCPVRDGGMLGFEEISLSDIEYSRGYLPYTTALVLDQAMKLLNTGYGWGGKDHLLDCSSTMLAVYECFGFSLPRNTSELEKCSVRATDVGMLGADAKKRKLNEVRPGSMLFMKGHVMMYLGEKDGAVYVLHTFTKYYDADGNKRRIMQCTITPLTLYKASGETYLDAVYTVLEVLPEAGE